MFKHRKSALFVTGILMALVMGCAQVSPQTRDSEDSLNGKRSTKRRSPTEGPATMTIYFDGTNGTVGHHMVCMARANCPVTWNSNNPQIVDGYLPSGLTLDGFRIVGIPQLPGNWYVKMKFSGPSCQGTSYPDQYVDINFYIQGDAPRQVQ